MLEMKNRTGTVLILRSLLLPGVVFFALGVALTLMLNSDAEQAVRVEQSVDPESFRCAGAEGESCRCEGTIYFGRRHVDGSPGSGPRASLAYLRRFPHKVIRGVSAASTVQCSNHAFGGDPLHGVYKQCYCVPRDTSLAPPPALSPAKGGPHCEWRHVPG